MAKIVVLDAATMGFEAAAWEPFQEFGEVVLYDNTAHDDPALIVERCQGATIALTNKVPFPREVLEQLPELKGISTLATGFNIIDLKVARAQGVTVSNAPGYSTESVAQHTLALVLELLNHVGVHNEGVHEGEWVRSELFCYWKRPVVELVGRTVAIVGWGSIGRLTGEVFHALGAEVLGVSRSRKNAPNWETGFRWVEMDEAFAEADIVSLHCPQTPETTHLVNADRLAKMKPGAILINTARGGLVEEAALAEALNSGQIGGAGLDVVAKEPMSPDNPLRGAKNCMITPHIAWAGEQSRKKLLDINLENVRGILDGKPQNVVN